VLIDSVKCTKRIYCSTQ